MLRVRNRYPGRTNVVTNDYPHGSIRNDSAPGANDGTPLEADWGNDYVGFDAALLAAAGITPNEVPDTARVSQRLQALRAIHGNIAASRARLNTLGLSPGDSVTTVSYYDDWITNDEPPKGGATYQVVTRAQHNAIRGTTTIDSPRDHLLNSSGDVAILSVERPNLYQFGARGDSVNNDSTAIASACRSVPADGGVIIVEPGIYRLEQTINTLGAVRFLCEGRTDISPGSNPTTDTSVTFRWAGAEGATMFVFGAETGADMASGNTSGETIFNPSMIGATLDGNGVAGNGIWLASTQNAEIDVIVREFIGNGVIVDGGNGALSVRNQFNIRAVWGTQDATRDMNGIVFRRLNNFPSTQNRLHSVSGLIFNGDLVSLGDTDNNVLTHIHGVTQSGGTGHAISFDSSAVTHARNNLVLYVNGDIRAEAGTRGNRIININSESSEVTVQPGAQLHYDAIDYINADLFETHRYKMSDELDIPVGSFIPDGTVAVHDTFAGDLWSTITFPVTAVGSAGTCIPGKHDWADGNITGFRLVFVGTGDEAGVAPFRVRINSRPFGLGVATPAIDNTENVNITGTENALYVVEENLTVGNYIAFNRGNSIFIRIDRRVGSADNTYTGNVNLVGVSLLYTSAGPNSGGSGPFGVTPPFI